MQGIFYIQLSVYCVTEFSRYCVVQRSIMALRNSIRIVFYLIQRIITV